MKNALRSVCRARPAIPLLCFCVFVGYMADMVLVPFYPQFFRDVYGVQDPRYVGYLIAFCRLTMMLAYPAWARLGKKVPTLKILISTQGLAGLSCLLCMFAPNEWVFLALAMVSVAFKSSYLLIYPLIVAYGGRSRQARSVSLYALLTHSAAVIAALLGGSLLSVADPRSLLLFMVLADWLQMLISWYLYKRTPPDREQSRAPVGVEAPGPAVSRLGVIWLVFLYYAALSMIRPYFTRFVEDLSFGLNGTQLGLLFVLPAFMCIGASLSYHKLRLDRHLQTAILLASAIIALTTWLQVSGHSLLQIAGARAVYGLALFMIPVGIDLLLFRNSDAEAMAWNYRVVAIAMNGALIVSPFSLGFVVQYGGLRAPFYVSTGISILLTVSALWIFFYAPSRKREPLGNPI